MMRAKRRGEKKTASLAKKKRNETSARETKRQKLCGDQSKTPRLPLPSLSLDTSRAPSVIPNTARGTQHRKTAAEKEPDKERQEEEKRKEKDDDVGASLGLKGDLSRRHLGRESGVLPFTTRDKVGAAQDEGQDPQHRLFGGRRSFSCWRFRPSDD